MSTDSHSTHTLASLRQWHRARAKPSSRPPSSSSRSSTDPSRPVTPQDSVFPHLHPQKSQRPEAPLRAYSVEEYRIQKSSGEVQPHSRSQSPVGSFGEGVRSEHDADDDFLEDFRPRTHTVTPATVLHDRQHKASDHMHIPFPGPSNRDSASSTESRPSYSGSESASVYDDEFGGIPARHPLRNRINSRGNSFADSDTRSVSPTKPQRVRAYTCRPDSMQSTQSSQSNQSSASSDSRTSLSLRLKPKKSHGQRAAMNIFKSLSSSPHPSPAPDLADIEFDWAGQRREELERRVRLLEQELDEEGNVVQVQTETGEESEKAGTSRPRSWELSPEELQLRRQQDDEDWRRFTFKDCLYVNGSYVSPHPRDIVPYPLGYDKVNMQTDRHSYDLLRYLLSGLPSIYGDLSEKLPGTVLDLGCGDGTWIIDAARSWNNTLFYGLDLQNLHPPRSQLVAELGEQAGNIRFTYYNFVQDKLPYLDEKFDLVRMANLKWAIPEDKWDFVLQEINRVLKRGGWVEIIDDDFLLGMSPNNTLSPDQRTACETLEAEFKAMLRERNLPLNTGTAFMHEKLGSNFSAFHEDDFAIAISKARPVSLEMHGHAPVEVLLPSEGVSSSKAAKLMGIGGLNSSHEKYGSFGSTRSSSSRSRSASVSSAGSQSTRVEAMEEEVDSPDDDELMWSVKALPKQPTYQPLGLDVHPGRFIPFPPHELNAHASRNMQSILASKEAIRGHELSKSPELEELEVKDDLTPEEKQRFENLSWEWKERRRTFDDMFWNFETAMPSRLGLPQRLFDVDDDDEVSKPPQRIPHPQPLRSASGLNKLHRSSDANISFPSPTASTFAAGSNVTVRLIRVHSGWK